MNIDNTAIYDIWNPTSHKFNGLQTNMIVAAKERALIDIFFLLSKSVKAYIVIIVADRTTDGDIPTKITYDQMQMREILWLNIRHL